MADPLRCLYTLSVGKQHWLHRGGKYGVCVTPKQHVKLFGTYTKERGRLPRPVPPTPLGCGVFACAYPGREPWTVTKITRDPSDVAAIQQNQDSRFVPKLYGVYRLASRTYWKKWDDRRMIPVGAKQRPDHVNAYAMALERLMPLNKREWGKRISCVLSNKKNPGVVIGRKVLATSQTISNEKLPALCCPKSKRSKECERVVQDVGEMIDDLNLSDVHAGNFGFDRNGNVKVLDMGLTPFRNPQGEDLAGVRKAKRRGARKASKRAR